MKLCNIYDFCPSITAVMNYLPSSGTNSVKVIIMHMAVILVPWIFWDRKFCFIVFSVKFLNNITFLMTVSWTSGVSSAGEDDFLQFSTRKAFSCYFFRINIQLRESSLSKEDNHKFLKFTKVLLMFLMAVIIISSCSYTTGKSDPPPPIQKERLRPINDFSSIARKLSHIQPENF